jgi:beta-alanine--pyruvate transaminase
VLIPPVGYLERLRAICDAHGLLLIFDEVITGFGRLGAPFAAQYFGVTPDIMTMAKGITNASVPMGATAVRRDIHDTVVESASRGIEFFHGYTYSGHPLAAAAGLATLELHAEEGLAAQTARMAPTWEAAVHALRDAPHVIDVRNVGLIGAVELAPSDGVVGARAYDVFVDAFFTENLLIRITGDTIALSPPLIISAREIEELVGRLRRCLERVA